MAIEIEGDNFVFTNLVSAKSEIGTSSNVTASKFKAADKTTVSNAPGDLCDIPVSDAHQQSFEAGKQLIAALRQT